jgi:hypothetical protein
VTDVIGIVGAAEDVEESGHRMVPLDSPFGLARDTTRLGPPSALFVMGHVSDDHVACHERGPEGAEWSGGGAGSCTRVRKHILAGIYDAYPRLLCRTRREDPEKPAGTNPEKSRRDRPRQPVTASLLK